jgi:hypothetical protein
MDGRISGDNLRNLQAVVHGQAKQAHTLPTHAQDIEEIKAMIEDGTGEKDSNGNGEAGGDQ